MENLKSGSMYVVDVAFSTGNPISRYVCIFNGKGKVNFPTTEESWKNHTIIKLSFFSVVEEVKSYSEKSKYHGKTVSSLRKDPELVQRYTKVQGIMGEYLEEYNQLDRIFKK
jgi:hypothetical protein